MHYVNGSYTNYINRRKRRSGHLFQGRYKAILVDRDSYLLELSRYVHLNPVRAKIVENPEAYSFNSAEKVIDVVAEHFQVTRHDVIKSKGLCRSVAIHLTKKHTGMTNRQIGEYFGGLSYSAVTKVQERLLAKAGKDIKVMKTIKAISNKMSNVKGCPILHLHY